ncbi:MAG: O-antigen ligase family protein [Prosthecobacter sp.]
MICLFGWLMALFPGAWVDRSTGIILELDKNPWLAFGTADQAASVQVMLSIIAALMVLLMTLDLARERRVRFLLAVAITVSGFGAAVTGLCLQTSADLARLWKVVHVPDSVFGLFWYHGNAAAYLNLCWPLALWLCVVLMRLEDRRLLQQIALACLVVGLAVQMVAVFANVSKMGHFLMILEVLLLAGAGFLSWRRQDLHEQQTVGKRFWLLVGVTVGILVIGAWMAGAASGWSRWGVFAGKSFDDPARRHAATMALKIGWDGGWNGTGPGTFEWVAAHYSTLDPVLKDGRWRHAHNDYAQFFAEWGWLGTLLAAAFGVLVLARIVRAISQALSADSSQHMSFQRRAGLLCFGAALVSVLVHAVVDFPLQIPAIRCLAGALLGMALALSHSTVLPRARPQKTKTRTRTRRRPATDGPQADEKGEGNPFFS